MKTDILYLQSAEQAELKAIMGALIPVHVERISLTIWLIRDSFQEMNRFALPKRAYEMHAATMTIKFLKKIGVSM